MFKNIIKNLKMSSNKKNIAKISSGTILGQGISIITLPIITRLYGAEIIGVWALLTSFAMIINSISDLGLTNSIMIESEDSVEKNYKVTSTLSALISIVMSGLISVLYFMFFDVVEINEISFFFYLVMLSFALQQIQICYTWLNRNGNYNVLMKNPVLNSGIFGVLAILLGFIGFKTHGYFVAHIFGYIVTLMNMKRNLPPIMFTLNMKDIFFIAKKNQRFVLYQAPTNIISRFKGQLPTLLIRAFWNTEILGYYSITVKVLQIPGTLLAKAIGRVFFQMTSKMKREGKDIGYFVLINLMRSMKIAIIPMILLMAFGDVVAVVFLGSEWIIAGDFVRILALQYYFVFLMSTVQGLSITLDKQNYAMVSSLSQALGYILGALIGRYVFQSVYIALLLMSLFFIAIQLVYFCSLFKVMNVSIRKYITNVLISIFTIVTFSYAVRSLFEYFGVIEYIYKLFNRVL